MKEVLIILILILLAVVGVSYIWSEADKINDATCKKQYGKEYKVAHSKTNSSVYWCEAPDGTMKAL